MSWAGRLIWRRKVLDELGRHGRNRGLVVIEIIVQYCDGWAWFDF